MKKILFLSIALAISALSPAQDAAMFRQWGDEISQLIESNFKYKNNDLYREAIGGAEAFAWPMGIQLKALIYAGKTDAAERMVTDFHTYYHCDKRGYEAYNAVCYGTDDRYYDDNAWIAKDLMDLYTQTHKELYLERTKMILKFCMSGECPDGGIRFHENHSDPNNKDYNHSATCATAPTACANLRLYQVIKEEKYLTDGKRLYDFMKTKQGWGIGGGYRGYENAVVMQAALLLYNITGEEVYLTDAQQLGYSMESCYISWQSHRLNEVGVWGGHDMTDAYISMYEADKNSYWLSVAAGYLSYLHDNCRDTQGFYPETWNDTEKNGKRFILMDQAAVAAAFYRMASTPGAEPKTLEPIAIFKHADWNNGNEGNSWSIGLVSGDYTKADLIFLGLTDNRFQFQTDITSLIVNENYKITLYGQDHFLGDHKELTATSNYLADWNDKAVSLKVEKLTTSIHFPQTETSSIRAYPTVFREVLNIQNLPDHARLEMMDIRGCIVLTEKANNYFHSINTSSLPQGLYFLRINEGQQVIKLQKR